MRRANAAAGGVHPIWMAALDRAVVI